MLIIGHRGAAGLAPENTIEALRAGMSAGADVLEFDVRLTADSIPVLAHNPVVAGKWVSQTTLEDLRQVALIATLQEVLDEFFGKILLNIELKQSHSAAIIYDTIALYITEPGEWDSILFSSFKPKALSALRKRHPHISLALLHHVNPFLFMRWHRELHLTAVGFHRLHANALVLAVAKELGLFTYVYTVDRPETAVRFDLRGIDGVVTNRPDEIKDGLQADA